MSLREQNILKAWQLKLAILTAIIVPSITGSSAYYGLQEKMNSNRAYTDQRLSTLELKLSDGFADKSSFQRIDERTQKIEKDIVEIKTLLKQRFR